MCNQIREDLFICQFLQKLLLYSAIFRGNNKSIMKFYFLIFSVLLFIAIDATGQSVWPETSAETKPWTRWWWHGNSVTERGISTELEDFHNKGFGGVELTPIFGVIGDEANFIEYLSPQWMDLMVHTLAEAERLGIKVDMATGTGWPFGGAWVNKEVCKKLIQELLQLRRFGRPCGRQILG